MDKQAKKSIKDDFLNDFKNTVLLMETNFIKKFKSSNSITIRNNKKIERILKDENTNTSVASLLEKFISKRSFYYDIVNIFFINSNNLVSFSFVFPINFSSYENMVEKTNICISFDGKKFESLSYIDFKEKCSSLVFFLKYYEKHNVFKNRSDPEFILTKKFLEHLFFEENIQSIKNVINKLKENENYFDTMLKSKNEYIESKKEYSKNIKLKKSNIQNKTIQENIKKINELQKEIDKLKNENKELKKNLIYANAKIKSENELILLQNDLNDKAKYAHILLNKEGKGTSFFKLQNYVLSSLLTGL